MRRRVITKDVILDVSLGDVMSQLCSTMQSFAMDARERNDQYASEAIQRYAADIRVLTANLLADVQSRRGNNLN